MKRLMNGALLTSGALFAQLFVGCSLTEIPFVRVGECTSDASCNEAFEAKCAEYECVAATDKKGKSYRQCRKIEGEILDGKDNDCDGLVDNTDMGDAPPSTVEGSEVASGLGDFTNIALANSDALTQIYVQGDGAASSVPPQGGEVADVTIVSNQSLTGNNKTLVSGCHLPGGDSAQPCNINDIAVAAGADMGFFAQVKTSGCRQGELRVGAIDPIISGELIDRGPTFRNPAYQGVATYGSACTQNTNDDCIAAKELFAELSALGATNAELAEPRDQITTHCGVSRPSIAAQGKQALVTFLSAQRDESDICGAAPVDVLGLILNGRTGPRGGEFFWTDPSGDGVPDLLGTTVGAQPPALHAVDGLGFLLALPDQSGRISLGYVPEQPPPPGNGGTDCPDDGCDTRTGLETDPISGFEELTQLSTSGIADGIRMQWLPISELEGMLLLTWVRGCFPTDDALEEEDGNPPTAYAQALRVKIPPEPEEPEDPEEPEEPRGPPEILWEGDVLNLGPTRSFPLAVPSDHQFVVAGLERNGRTATERDLGGFYVLTRPLGLQAVRVAAFDGARIATGEVIPVDPLSDDPNSRPNTYRYLGAMGPSNPNEFFFKSTSEATLFRGTFTGN